MIDGARLSAARYRVLTTLPDEVFSRLTHLAAQCFQVPIAVISLLGEDRQWVSTAHGLSLRGTDPEPPLCRRAMQTGDIVSSADPRQDSRPPHRHPPPGEPDVRFYASAPLVTSGGLVIGALWVADPEARPALEDAQRQTLRALAALVTDQLELHLQTLEARRVAQASAATHKELRSALRTAELMRAVVDLMDLDLGTGETLLHVAALTAATLAVDWGGLTAIHGDTAFWSTAWCSPEAGDLPRLVEGGTHRRDGGLIWQAEGSPGLFSQDYSGSGMAHPALTAAGVRTAAAASLGGLGDTEYLLVLARIQRDSPWTQEEQHLVREVAQAVRQGLSRLSRRAELRRSTAYLRFALNAAPLVLWTTAMDGTFTLSEGRGLQALGRAPGQIVGQHYTEVFAQEPAVMENLARTLEGHAFSSTVNVGDRIYEARYEPLRNDAGQQVGAIGTGYDVTELMRSTQQARQARLQAEALLELSRVLLSEAEVVAIAGAAMAALEGVLGDTALALWQQEGGMFRPLAQQGPLPPQVRAFQQRGIPVGVPEALGVLAGQACFLHGPELPEAARQLGMESMAVLPALLDASGPRLLLGAYRFQCSDGWAAAERDLLGAAARTLGAGMRLRRALRPPGGPGLTDFPS